MSDTLLRSTGRGARALAKGPQPTKMNDESSGVSQATRSTSDSIEETSLLEGQDHRIHERNVNEEEQRSRNEDDKPDEVPKDDQNKDKDADMHQVKRLKTDQEASLEDNDFPLPLPLLSCGSVILNADVMENIVGFVNGDATSFCALTAVSKDVCNALVPRQGKVWIGGFKSFENFKRWNFVGMELLSGRDCDFVTDDVLKQVSNDRKRFPHFKGVDLTGCVLVSAQGAESLVDDMGPRLETFVGGAYYWSLIRRLAHAANPPSLSIPPDFSLLDFCEGFKNLQELTVMVNTRISCSHLFRLSLLPTYLRVLRIRTTSALPIVLWHGYMTVNLPHLKTLEIADMQTAEVEVIATDKISLLSADVLIGVMSKATELETLTVRSVGTSTPLYLGEPNEQEERLFSFLEARGIKYIGPRHVTKKCGADFRIIQGGVCWGKSRTRLDR